MKTIQEIATEKFKSLDYPIYTGIPIMAQIINAVLTLTTEAEQENLDLNRYDLEEVIFISQQLLTFSDKAVMRYLGLMDPDHELEMAQYLEEAKTLSQIKEVVIENLLVQAITETEEPEPQ